MFSLIAYNYWQQRNFSYACGEFYYIDMKENNSGKLLEEIIPHGACFEAGLAEGSCFSEK